MWDEDGEREFDRMYEAEARTWGIAGGDPRHG